MNPLMQRDFNVTVYEGRTLLTGTTSSPGAEGSGDADREPDPGRPRGL